MRQFCVSSFAALLIAAAAPRASVALPVDPAQTVSPRFMFHGHVLDPTRAPVAAARVLVVPEGGSPAVPVLTDERGEFTLLLEPGAYTIRVASAGFLDAVHQLRASAAGTVSREFVLELAGVREHVTVNATAGYRAPVTISATKTPTPLSDVPQSIAVVTKELIADQLMTSVGDVVRYVPGITTHQGENNRDQIIVRGNGSSADFFVDGVRDDVQYFRDLYNLDRVEALKGPNAMMFGRGGAGGVVNRVTKQADFLPVREVSLQGGGFGQGRLTADLDQPFGGAVAFRVNGMYENAGSFRKHVTLERGGVSPTVTIAPSENTNIRVSYEYLRDARVADRGVTSFQGQPVDVDISTYYGNPNESRVKASVNLASTTVEHRAGAVLIRNHTLLGHYDRGYQNYVPGPVSPDKSQVTLSAYDNATIRTNVFNQTDVIYAVATGGVRHTLLAGAEVGRQLTDNVRNTGFFGNTVTSVQVPYENPTIEVPVTFRPNATDANNHVRTQVAAAYAQDQIELTRQLQVVAGLRLDRFDLEYHNNRNGDTLDRVDLLFSPRAGIVFKPIVPLSIYGSYSVSHLPSSGDQFSALTTVTRQMEPEEFRNYELGAKWDARPGLALTTAVYRLNRTNTRAVDPSDPARIVQTGGQRTNGYELGLTGRMRSAWQMAGGYAYQDAFVTSATTSAAAGAIVGQVPRHTLSLWNKYQVHRRAAAGLGVVYRSDMYAAIDEAVTLPGYTRADGAAYVSIGKGARVQLNVENLFNKTYFINADSNTNISPGSPRSVRVGVTTNF